MKMQISKEDLTNTFNKHLCKDVISVIESYISWCKCKNIGFLFKETYECSCLLRDSKIKKYFCGFECISKQYNNKFKQPKRQKFCSYDYFRIDYIKRDVCRCYCGNIYLECIDKFIKK
jgi:hypothetical protein